MKRIVCVLILLSLAFSLFSCRQSIFPKGYTGGLGIPFGSGREIFWVEGLQETVDCATVLKNNSSSFLGGYIFEEDDTLFDVKYCFIFDNDKDKIKYGDSPYDRYAELVEIRSYGFYSDVTIDELNYSKIEDYSYITVEFTELYYEKYSDGYIDPIFFDCRWDDGEECYFGEYEGERVFKVIYNNPYVHIPSDESLLTIFSTLIYVGEMKEE